MLRQNSHDVFYVTYSKWKVWTYTALCWAIACIPLLAFILVTREALKGERAFNQDDGLFLLVFGLVFLPFAAIPFLFLTRLNKPLAILTPEGFSGKKNAKDLSLPWSSETISYPFKNNIILANPDDDQSRISKLWGGPKAAVCVYNIFAKQTRQEVMEVINKLCPYPIKDTTLWNASR